MQAASEFAEISPILAVKASLSGWVIVLIKDSVQLLKLESSILFLKTDSCTVLGFAWLKIAPAEPGPVFNLEQKPDY